MTHDQLDEPPPVTVVLILRAPRKVYLPFQALFRWLKHATFNIEFDAGFATGMCRVMNQIFR